MHRMDRQRMQEYERLHMHPINLAIHMATVPLFAIGLLGVVLCPFLPRLEIWLGVGVCLIVYSVLLQRFGHRLEAGRPPSVRKARAVEDFLREQFVIFPCFVVQGGWARNVGWSRGSGARNGRHRR